MAENVVRVAVTQAEPAWFDLAAGVAKTCDLIVEAAKNNAQLITFPECWIPGYPCWIWARLIDVELNIAYAKNSLRLDSPELNKIRDCARDNGIAVSLSFSEKENHSLYIAQVMIGTDGEIKFHRRKMKPTHIERTIFGDASGEALSSVADLSFARVGSLACAEHIQPLLKYHTMSQSEDIHVSAWPTPYLHDGGESLWFMSEEGCQSASQIYAIESQSFVLHCTQILGQSGIDKMRVSSMPPMTAPGGGSSVIFAPDGRRLTEPVESTTEKIIYGDLPLDLITATKFFFDPVGHYSRPDLMSLHVCTKVKKMVREEEREPVHTVSDVQNDS
ncbi:Carbon-nitrogen hydrolase [Penicillium angulare]|uniref:nitrilase n=1 Tax=Penicillium angulare TaxID=116970 RepID=A0A9W9K956_9EURO|nr:Carbon-nitrogen hydrolase [Penicillium angulare]